MAQAKSTTKILTANLLRTGDTVYYTAEDTWSLHVSEARVATTPEEADILAQAGAAAFAANLVIDVAVVDVVPGEGPQPAHIREIIRAAGPTVRLDLNKDTAPAQR